jgi:hypothetical protein
MTRRTVRAATAQRRVLQRYQTQVALSQRIGAVRARLWFKPPAPKVVMTAGRVQLGDTPIGVGTFAGAKLAAHESAEHWADALLRYPTHPGNRGTARFAGKPYHWRQDYTGQLKLAAGESPW